MWQKKLRGILARDDWEAELQAIIDAGESLEVVRRALRNAACQSSGFEHQPNIRCELLNGLCTKARTLHMYVFVKASLW